MKLVAYNAALQPQGVSKPQSNVVAVQLLLHLDVLS
jgi:hypothetical protein